MNGQTTVGTVLDIQGKRVTVAFGLIKSTMVMERLELVSKKRI